MTLWVKDWLDSHVFWSIISSKSRYFYDGLHNFIENVIQRRDSIRRLLKTDGSIPSNCPLIGVEQRIVGSITFQKSYRFVILILIPQQTRDLTPFPRAPNLISLIFIALKLDPVPRTDGSTVEHISYLCVRAGFRHCGIASSLIKVRLPVQWNAWLTPWLTHLPVPQFSRQKFWLTLPQRPHLWEATNFWPCNPPWVA